MAIRRATLSVSEAKRLAFGTQHGVDPSNASAERSTVTGEWGNGVPAVQAAAGTSSVGHWGRPEASEVADPVGTEAVARVQVFVSACLPVKGVSLIYDQLCLEYRPAKSLQMILRRAMDDYEALLADGHGRRPAPAYDSTQAVVQTSRMMPVDLLAIARTQFDPLRLESSRVFGRKLAGAALGFFFENEWKRSR